MLLSISKRAIILTKEINGKQIPIIVKSISKYLKNKDNNTIHITDSKGNKWTINKSPEFFNQYIKGDLDKGYSITMQLARY